MMDTNVKGLIYVSRTVLPFMVEQNSGHVLNIGSTAGAGAYAKGAVYCASKAAVKTISDGMRIDLIATNVQPGITETDFSKVRFHGDAAKAAKVYEGIEALQAEDIANAVVYCTNQPRRVQISDITVMVKQQATNNMKHKVTK